MIANLRYRSFVKQSSSFLKGCRATVAIGYLRGAYYSGLASFIARNLNIPLGYFYHDATELFPDMVKRPYERNRFLRFKKRLIRTADTVWAISPAMCNEPECSGKSELIFPLSEAPREELQPIWCAERISKPIVSHAGTVYDQIVEPLVGFALALREVGGELRLYTSSTVCAEEVRQRARNTRVVKPLPAAEAVEEISRTSAAVITAYPERLEDMPWTATCFPSKYAQFAATGLPSWVLAPRESALRKWADVSAPKGVFSNYGIEAKSDIIRFLEREEWNLQAAQTRRIWRTEFSPEIINSLFLDSLSRLTRRQDLKH